VSDFDSTLRRWSVEARTHIRRRLRDARAHAEAGRSFDAAERLAELTAAIKREILEPARREFYCDGFTTALSELDPGIVDPTVQPTVAGSLAAITAPIGGRDQAKAIGSSIEAARGELRFLDVVDFDDPSTRSAAIDTWERRHSERIGQLVTTSLSDAQIALREAISQIVIKPEYR
jgi:hypothetical protein